MGFAVTMPPPSPTAFSALAGTEVTWPMIAADAAATWPLDPDEVGGGAVLVFNLIRTKVSAIAATRKTMPTATRIPARGRPCIGGAGAASGAVSFADGHW